MKPFLQHTGAVLPRIARPAIAVWALCVPAAPQPSIETKVPLPIDLPKPVFVGTPQCLVSPNLEKVSGKLRGPFRAPRGVVNVARSRPVIGNDPAPFLGRLEMITDGDKEGDGDSFVELNPGLRWIQIDLGSRYRVFAILVWHYHGEARVYHDVVIQFCNSPDFIDGPRTVYNNDHDNSSGLGVGGDKEYVETFEGRLIDTQGRVTRYVRLYSNGNTTDDMNNYVEVEVYGLKPLP